MKYVLIIPGWFPSKVNFLTGDFIERHARAASAFFPVKVLFVVKNEQLPFGKVDPEHIKASDNYEVFIYYYSSGKSKGLFQQLASAFLQARCFSKGFGKIVQSYGYPSLIHAHVLVKHAWFALQRSRRYGIPLLASEQWTGYLPQAKHEFEKLSALQKNTIRSVLQHAVHLTTVSEYLAQQIKKRFHFHSHTVIPNLVDTNIFMPVNRSDSLTTFVHVSTLSQQKNIDDLLAACKILMSAGTNFRLDLVAPENLTYIEEVNDLNLREYVFFHPEVPQDKLARWIADSDALILYSNYETFGCVIVEANACGIPVITSDHPVFSENVIEGVTGFRVPLHQPQLLAECMMKFINKDISFNKQEIINTTKEKYAAEVIGKQFAELYNRYAKA